MTEPQTPQPLSFRSRARGALLGLAVGDALGTTLEFLPRGTFQPIDDLVGGGRFGLAPGQWTDDTSMALCLAESLALRGRFDAHDQMTRYVRWWREGYLSSTGTCVDIGTTIRTALTRFVRNGDPLAGSDDPNTAGNGSLMRLAPVPIFFASDPVSAIAHAALSSRTTHAAVQAVDACRWFAGLLVGALHGAGRNDLLSPRWAPVPGIWSEQPLDPRIEAIASGSFRKRQPPAIRGNGYVVNSLEAALWAFHTTSDFRSGALAAANLGEDADTTAAIYGQLAGAFYGEEGIPGEWLRILHAREKIADLADALAAHGEAGPTRVKLTEALRTS